MTRYPILSKAIRRHCLGGRELLVLEYDLPSGSTPAATHFCAMVQALLRFAEETYLPIAAAQLQDAVAKQAVHCFFSYRYRVKLHFSNQKECAQLTLTVTLLHGSKLLQRERLITLWEPTLSLQLPQNGHRQKD